MKTTMMIRNTITHKLFAAALVVSTVVCGAPAMAADVEVARPVASMFTLDVGHASVRDTYLSPNTYGGTHLRLGYQAVQATEFSPVKWARNLELGVEYDNVENTVGNHTMHSLMVDGRWSLMHRWQVGSRLRLLGGGAVMLRGGAIYKPSNSNNVCSVKAHLGVGLAGMAVFPTRVGRLPITLSYQLTMPVVGAFYSPKYDESYYEIYVGNHSGLVHAGWWGNRFEVSNLVSADLHIGNTIVRVGYRHGVERSSIHNLNTRITSHSVVVGIGGNFLSLGRKSVLSRTISPLY